MASFLTFIKNRITLPHESVIVGNENVYHKFLAIEADKRESGLTAK